MLNSPERDQMLRVLIVTPLGMGGSGGIDRVVDQLRGPDALRSNLELDFAVSRGKHLFSSLYNVPRTALRIGIGAMTGRLDIVHLNLSSNASAYRKLVLAWTCRVFGVPYVIHLHGSRFHKFWPGLPSRRKRAVDSLFRHASSIIVLGQVWRDLVVTHVPEIADRVFIVPNATQTRSRARGSAGAPSILFLGRLGERKGVPDLLQALAAMPGDLQWTATVAGDGDIDATAQQVRVLGLQARVTIPGWVGAADVEQLIDKADVLVLPSYDENLPMSVIEGMAAGLAVVATPVGATADVIKHGVTGLMVNPGDIAGLTSALQQLADDEGLRRRLGAAAQLHHREHLDSGRYVDRLLAPWTFAKVVRTAARRG